MTHKHEKCEIAHILGAYLTHTAKVSETEQEAKDHFENCGWCQNWVATTVAADNAALARQIGHEAIKRSQDR